MHRGFELGMSRMAFENELCADTGISFGSYLDTGKSMFARYKQEVEGCIAAIRIDTESVIDGNKVENSWFPKRQFHVFISHSHKDEELAIAYAGYLKKHMALDAFVDSCVWGYRDQLIARLKSLLSASDNCCFRGNGKACKSVISHVDCMLGKSLAEMEDSTECLMFMNTPNSVCVKHSIKQTYSPWIYAELEVSRILRDVMDGRRTRMEKSACLESFSEDKMFLMTHDLDTNHLKKLTTNDVKRWKKVASSQNAFDSLDRLYEMSSERQLVAS
ncbi:MAG: hypothetical protein Q4E94_03930 [Clostridia bacterium]|nr:hypothetical protein [Clostridia bacterium]